MAEPDRSKSFDIERAQVRYGQMRTSKRRSSDNAMSYARSADIKRPSFAAMPIASDSSIIEHPMRPGGLCLRR